MDIKKEYERWLENATADANVAAELKTLDGARAINAIELHKISEYLHVPMETLMKMPEHPVDTNVIHAFMGRVKTPEARRGIQIADELSDMILFHTKVYENGKRMEQPWEDNE